LRITRFTYVLPDLFVVQSDTVYRTNPADDHLFQAIFLLGRVDCIAVLGDEVCFHLDQDSKVESCLCDQPELAVDHSLDMR